MHKRLHVLITLAQFQQHDGITISTTQLAQASHLSQQSASRILIQLEKENLIKRSAGKNGSTIVFTPRGKGILQQVYLHLQQMFSPQKKNTITGRVTEGIGEGKYYMSQQGYKTQFKQKLGYVPYAGTLNLRVSPTVGNAVYDNPTFFRIEGFSTKDRNFGGLRCKKTQINGTLQGAIIIPDRTAHNAETIELIAPVSLRKKLKLKNGSLVRIVC